MFDANGFGEPGGFCAPAAAAEEEDEDLLLDSGIPSLKLRASGGPRTRRMLDGKEVLVGVAGRTLTEWCGERPGVLVVDTEPVELVELAFECEWWWCGMVRMDDNEEEVDFRPRSPVDERRIVERGVNGAGDRDCRLYDEAADGIRRGPGLEGVESGAGVGFLDGLPPPTAGPLAFPLGKLGEFPPLDTATPCAEGGYLLVCGRGL